MKFNTRIVANEGKEYVFVAKGNQKITDNDIKAFFNGNSNKDCEKDGRKEERAEVAAHAADKPKFSIRDELKKIFLTDLKFGLEFCCRKYGATENEIIREARRLAPEINIELLMKRG